MTVSYERRYYSVGWNSVVSTPRARAKAPFSSPHPSPAVSRPSPLPSPILPPPLRRHLPLWSLSLSLSVCPCPLSFSLRLQRVSPHSLLSSLFILHRRSLERLSSFSSSNRPANSRSPRPTLRLSLSLTKTSSFRRAPLAGRTHVLSLSLSSASSRLNLSLPSHSNA